MSDTPHGAGQLPALSKTTPVQLGLVLALMGTAVGITTAWNSARTELVEARRDINEMRATLDQLDQSLDKGWTKQDQRNWIGLANSRGANLPTVEEAGFMATLTPYLPFKPYGSPLTPD